MCRGEGQDQACTAGEKIAGINRYNKATSNPKPHVCPKHRHMNTNPSSPCVPVFFSGSLRFRMRSTHVQSCPGLVLLMQRRLSCQQGFRSLDKMTKLARKHGLQGGCQGCCGGFGLAICFELCPRGGHAQLFSWFQRVQHRTCGNLCGSIGARLP